MKGRFAPSPTGYMHLGNCWVALLSYASARSKDGSYLLRIEDIDQQRSKPHYAEALLEDLTWLGLTWDEEPIYQSHRFPIYEEYLQELRRQEILYPCGCHRSRLQQIASAPHEDDHYHVYDGYCWDHPPAYGDRPPSWRVHMPTRKGEFVDYYWGRTCYEIEPGIDDIVLQRWDGMFAYHLAVVIDDHEMGITEVIRGCDLLDVTGHQIVLGELLGWPALSYGHVPMLKDRQGYRLSKRQSSITVRELRAKGMTASYIWGQLALDTGLVNEDDLSRSGELSLEELLQLDWNTEILSQDGIILTKFDVVI